MPARHTQLIRLSHAGCPRIFGYTHRVLSAGILRVSYCFSASYLQVHVGCNQDDDVAPCTQLKRHTQVARRRPAKHTHSNSLSASSESFVGILLVSCVHICGQLPATHPEQVSNIAAGISELHAHNNALFYVVPLAR